MKIFFTSLLLALAVGAVAQTSGINTGGCGTVTPQSEVDKIYDFVQHNPAAYKRGTGGITDSIPLKIHIVGTDAGTGYYSLNNLFLVICQLNQRFLPVGFHFYLQWPINYVDNTTYYAHDFNDGDVMMSQNNVSNAVNVYFVQDPAGACGYYTYNQDAVAIGKNCANTNSTTLVHELGHYFSLPHTFYGWENGRPGNPERIIRNGPTSNCNFAGDGFCDTYADYLTTRWSCPGPVGMTDDNGDTYHLDSSMYMSYSLDACQKQFSNQQMAAMQHNVQNVRQRFSGAASPAPAAMDSVRMIYPMDTLYANLKFARWRRAAGADYYYVRIARQAAPQSYLQTVLTADTSLEITASFVNDGKYLVNIVPVNAHNTCMDQVTKQLFTYTTNNGKLGISRIANGEQGIHVYPNPASNGQPIMLSITGIGAGDYDLSLRNMNGQLIEQDHIMHNGYSTIHQFDNVPSVPGVYFIQLKGKGVQMIQKLVVQ